MSARWIKLVIAVVLVIGVPIACAQSGAQDARSKSTSTSATSSVSTTSSTTRQRTTTTVPSTVTKAQPSASSSSSTPSASSTPTNPDGAPLSECLPYKGMSAAYLDQTWLGAHDGEREAITGGGLKKGSVPYYWLAQNGTDDHVFTAYVRDGKVIAVQKDHSQSSYWIDPETVRMRDLPDLTASGLPVSNKKTQSDTPPDPQDYDNIDEYAEDAEEWFSDHGSSDPYADAERYWEEKY